MRGLAAEYYASPEIFARERERLFRRLWLFVGLKLMVARSGAYYARTLAGVPVVLQNLDGELACFVNVCAHRNAQVQPDGFGVRGLVCGYHGFRYAIDGSVASIPMGATHYAFPAEERACLRLRKLALVTIGQFVFVNFADAPLPIDTQFSQALRSDLESLSPYLDTELIHANSTGRYNWKLAGENLRDALHPRFVHPQSLFPYVDFERGSATHVATEPPSLRDASSGGADGYPKTLESWAYWDALARWPRAEERYYNWLLFPNLHIVSPDGCRTFGIEQYDPVDAGTTELVHFMLTARRTRPLPEGKAILRGLLRNARVVLDEDARMMESVQRSLNALAPPIRHGAHETELVRFLTVAREALGD